MALTNAAKDQMVDVLWGMADHIVLVTEEGDRIVADTMTWRSDRRAILVGVIAETASGELLWSTRYYPPEHPAMDDTRPRLEPGSVVTIGKPVVLSA